MKLNKVIINSAIYNSPNKGRCFLWDDEIRGFGVRIYPSGKKSFVLSYRALGRKHLLTIGDIGVLTLDQARREARIKLGEIAQGTNPLIEKQRRSNLSTVKSLMVAYLNQHSKIHKKSWKEDERRINTLIIPQLGTIPLVGLTVADVTAFHQRLGGTSVYGANRTLEVLRGAIEKGKLWGFLDPSAVNPAKFIHRFKEKKRDRWLTPEELPKVATAIAQEGSVYVKAAIWLYLLTGVRKSELLQAKWSDIDVFRNELRIEETKNGTTHYVPLSSAALEVLKRIPKISDNPYVIVGLRPGTHLVNITKPWMRIRKRAGVEDVRLHDLRRTCGSWLAQNGASLHLISRVLNHASSETTKVYARFGQDSVRGALEGHGERMLSIADGPSKKVIPIRGEQAK